MSKNNPPLMHFPRPGEVIGNYKVESQLGEGTYGFVYKVKSKVDKKVYALKMLKLWNIMDEPDRVKIKRRFSGEYECGRIRSEFLVRTIDKGEVKGNPYIVMEYLANGDLRKRLSDFRRIKAINKLATEVLMGLKDLHRNGIIHRDIKPENVMLDAKDTAKLADFGIAGFLNARMTVPNFFSGKVHDTFGTYAYIAPEQLLDHKKFKSTSDRTDLFSFGVMMYEVFSGGNYPFGPLDSHAQLADYIKNASQGQIIDLRKFRPDAPKYWLDLLNACLNPKFEERAKTVEQVLRYLPNGPVEEVEEPFSFHTDELVLTVTQGEQTGRVYPLSTLLKDPDGLVRIGWFDRQAPYRNDIEIVENATAYVSNFHATIERNWDAATWMIRDGQYREKNGRLGWYFSKNGVSVNYEVIGDNAVPIHPGDIITLGDTHLKMELQKTKASNQFRKT